MFNKKNTIIIALIAIFTLGSILLNADVVDIQVSNVYSRNYGHEPVEFVAEGYGNHDFSKITGELHDLDDPWIYWENQPIFNSAYECEAKQDNRSVSGVRYSSQWLWYFRLPGRWEPIPDDPPIPD